MNAPMNFSPMNLLPTPAASPLPAAAATPPRGAPDSGFARCLDRAVERDHAADEPPATESSDRPDDAREADAAKARAARGARRSPPPTPGARKADTAAAASAATEPTTLPTQAGTEADAATEGDATGTAPAPGTDLSAPPAGWAPREAVAGAADAADLECDAVKVADARLKLSPTRGGPPEAARPAEGTAPAAGAPAKAAEASSSSTPPAATEPTHAAALPRRTADLAAPTAPWSPALAPSLSVAPAHAGDTAVAQAHVAAPVDSPGFAPALATQVRWLVRDGVQQAQLTLNPAEMGPVTVQIVLDGREARIDFLADLAATRSAIESSLPTLAAALDDSGLRLSGGGVHDGQASRHGQPGWTAQGRVPQFTAGASDETPHRGAPGAAARPAAAARGLVDLVA